MRIRITPQRITGALQLILLLGALIISVMGWRYLRNPQEKSFLERWIEAFIERNPRFFDHQK